MMAKRGDPVAKAFAGSLHTCHDEEFTTVGKFSSRSFGSASFVRRGDGKQGYLAGLQNFSNLTLNVNGKNMPKRMYFFSWKGVYMHWTDPSPPKNGLKMSWKGLDLIFKSKMLMELKYGIQRVLILSKLFQMNQVKMVSSNCFQTRNNCCNKLIWQKRKENLIHTTLGTIHVAAIFAICCRY